MFAYVSDEGVRTCVFVGLKIGWMCVWWCVLAEQLVCVVGVQ